MTMQAPTGRVVSSGYDVKQPLLEDFKTDSFDNASLPSYHIEEPGTELAVGGEKKSWFSGCREWRERWKHRRCCHTRDANGKKKKRSKAFRMFKVLAFLGVVFFGLKLYFCHSMFHSIRTLECVPLDSGSLTETYVIPVESPSTHLVFHSSFASPDVRVVRDDTLPAGEIHVAVKGEVPALPTTAEDDEKDHRPLACVVAHSKFSGAAFVATKKDSPLPTLTSTVIRVPANFKTPSLKLLGSKEGPSDRKMRKILKWWRKKHEEQTGAKH